MITSKGGYGQKVRFVNSNVTHSSYSYEAPLGESEYPIPPEMFLNISIIACIFSTFCPRIS